MPFSPRLDSALAFAASAHEGQVRKGTETPYIVHPVHVSHALALHGFDEDVVIAGLLHDTIEDCGVTADEIRGRFGERVAELVLAVTQVKTPGEDRKATWRRRKEEAIAHVARSGADVAALKAADTMHNAASTLSELRSAGDAVWRQFNGEPADIVWYYGEIARACGCVLGEHPLVAELAAVVEALRALAERGTSRA